MVSHMSAMTNKVNQVEKKILGCDEHGCAAIGAAAAAAAGIDAAAAGPMVEIDSIEDWADCDCESVVSEGGLDHEGRC